MGCRTLLVLGVAASGILESSRRVRLLGERTLKNQEWVEQFSQGLKVKGPANLTKLESEALSMASASSAEFQSTTLSDWKGLLGRMRRIVDRLLVISILSFLTFVFSALSALAAILFLSGPLVIYSIELLASGV